MRFIHESFAQRVSFATNDAAGAVAAEVEVLGARRAILIASDRDATLAAPIAAELPLVLHHQEIVMHVPVEVAVRAQDACAAAGADVVVCVGGGSTTGLAKAVALTTGLPIIAVPTTYAGSEATNVWGLTEDETKTTGVDDRVLPASVVYDAALLTSLPGDMTVASGLNALAHCVDAMWGPRVDPIDHALAQEAIRVLASGLPVVKANPASIEGIENTLYGAYLAGVTFASAGPGMHHKVCHVLGGMFNLPHAQTHAVVLPYVLAFNAPYAPEAQRRIAAGFGASSATAGLRELREVLEAPQALRHYGMPEEGIDKAIEPLRAVIPASNPAPVTDNNLQELLRATWEGALYE